jgi:regulator of replication initiation timing
VIKILSEKIQNGIKFFVGHGSDNSTDNRESVGEVLSSFTKEIKGRLSNVIIGWFPNKEKVQAMDICSMEADIHTDEESNIVGDINKVTGIALGNSKVDDPAFPGALRLNMVQCFTEVKPNLEKEKRRMEISDITFEMVKQRVHELNIFPWQLYELKDFQEDKHLSKIFTENATLKAENERLSTENKEINDKSKETIRKSELTTAQDKLDKLMTEGFTDKQKQFIKKEFNPEIVEDLSEEGLNKFIDEGKKKFAETAKLFGAEGSETKPNPKLDENGGNDTPDEAAFKQLIGEKS